MKDSKTTTSMWLTTSKSVWIAFIIHIIALWNVGFSQHLSEVRLVNGTSQYSGIVEILDGARSTWLTVCHTPSWGIIDVLVICRQLGHAGASRAFTVEEPNPDRPISFYDQQFNCRGSEAEVNDCPRIVLDTSALDACTPAWASCHDEHYLGCYGDNRYDRVLTAATYPMTNSMSPQLCTEYCRELGHAYAGVEYASECYCGGADTDYSQRQRFSDKHCQVTCVGNPTESCGGVQKIALFRTVLQPTTVPMTTVETTMTTSSPSTTAIATQEATTAAVAAFTRGPKSTIIPTMRRTPPTTIVSPDKTSTTMVVEYTGPKVSTSTITGLAAGGGILFLVCSAVLLFIAILYRRRRKKASVMNQDPSPYALSASVEVIMDTTYLDPMNSIGDSAVYSGLSQVSESEFDSTFGGATFGGGEGGGGGQRDFSTYLGLTFQEMQRRHEAEYASLNAGLKKEGSFATTRSGETGEVSDEITYSDASGFETSHDSENAVTIPKPIPGQPVAGQPVEGVPGLELYDEPHKSGIYISGTGLCPFKNGFEFDARVYSPVHQASYYEIGDRATAEGEEIKFEAPSKLVPTREKRGPLRSPVSREYASVFPQLSQLEFSAHQLDGRTGQCQNAGRLESGDYASVSDLEFKSKTSCLHNDISEDKHNHRTLPASARMSPEPQARLGNSRNGDYDSVYFEGRKQSKTLPDSRRRPRIESVPFPSVLYPDYATIGDESDMQLKFDFTSDDTFETEDVVNNMDHSYSYVDHKKFLIAKNKKCSVKDLSLSSEGSVTSPNYENVDGSEKSAKAAPRISVSSILSQMSHRGQLRKYSSLEEDGNEKETVHPIRPKDIQNRKPSATMPRNLRSSEVEYAVVDKASRNSEPALYAKQLSKLNDDDYDVLQHTTLE